MQSRRILTFLPGLIISALTGLAYAQAPAASQPVTVAMVHQAPDITDWKVGDIEATFADGHKELLTKGEKCDKPRLSTKGDIGWSVWNDFDHANPAEHTGETLRVRLQDGTTKDFKPNSRFIMDWNFVDDGTAVVIASMGYHGPQFYVKYELTTGHLVGQVEGYTPYAELPKWAQPFSDDKP